MRWAREHARPTRPAGGRGRGPRGARCRAASCMGMAKGRVRLQASAESSKDEGRHVLGKGTRKQCVWKGTKEAMCSERDQGRECVRKGTNEGMCSLSDSNVSAGPLTLPPFPWQLGRQQALRPRPQRRRHLHSRGHNQAVRGPQGKRRDLARVRCRPIVCVCVSARCDNPHIPVLAAWPTTSSAASTRFGWISICWVSTPPRASPSCARGSRGAP